VHRPLILLKNSLTSVDNSFGIHHRALSWTAKNSLTEEMTCPHGEHDPFSFYRVGFEVRTYRLCQRVLMFHHFPAEEEVGNNCLVRSTDLVYRSVRNHYEDLRKDHPRTSFTASITQSGYKRKPDGGYRKKSLPPLELEYGRATVEEGTKEVAAETLKTLPHNPEGANHKWVDPDGEGLSNVFTRLCSERLWRRPISPVPCQRKRKPCTQENTAPRSSSLRSPSGSPRAGKTTHPRPSISWYSHREMVGFGFLNVQRVHEPSKSGVPIAVNVPKELVLGGYSTIRTYKPPIPNPSP